MIRHIFSGVVLSLISIALHSQQIFLQFDNACMNRMEYKSSSFSSSYISYATMLQGGDLLVMDIGTSTPKMLRTRPSEVYSCTTFSVSTDLVKKINNGEARLALFFEDGGSPSVLEVDKVTLFRADGKRIKVFSQDVNFFFNPDSLVSGVNLADADSKLQVFLEGIIQVQCAKGYIFRKRVNPRSLEYKEWVFLPEIGIIEKSSGEASGFNSEERKTTLRLDKIDDVPYHDFLTSYCDRLQAEMYDKTTASKSAESTLSSTDVGTSTKSTSQIGGPSVVSSPDPCNTPAGEGVHIVQKGETLYGIARRYGISLDDLRRWNNLVNSNVINVCQHLYVRDPATVGTMSAVNQTIQPKGNSSNQPGTTSPNDQLHIVKPGETVAMLAQLYGYTEERFRKMNGLAPNEEIVPGQRLRTSDCVCPPAAESSSEGATTNAKTAEPENFYKPIKVHVVKKSDTLYSIAKQYNTTPERILELNGLKKGDSIKPNQRLYVQ